MERIFDKNELNRIATRIGVPVCGFRAFTDGRNIVVKVCEKPEPQQEEPTVGNIVADALLSLIREGDRRFRNHEAQDEEESSSLIDDLLGSLMEDEEEQQATKKPEPVGEGRKTFAVRRKNKEITIYYKNDGEESRLFSFDVLESAREGDYTVDLNQVTRELMVDVATDHYDTFSTLVELQDVLQDVENSNLPEEDRKVRFDAVTDKFYDKVSLFIYDLLEAAQAATEAKNQVRERDLLDARLRELGITI